MAFTSVQSLQAPLVIVSIPPKLEREIAELKTDHQLEVHDDGDWISLVFMTFDLGTGFNQATSNLLLRVPRSYPDAGPDMFWVDPSVTLASGQVPQSAEALENYLGRTWRRFSWHRSRWNPLVDNIHGHLEFIRRRLREKK